MRDSPSWISDETYAQIKASGTNAHRVFSSRRLWIERFSGDFLLSHHTDTPPPGILKELDHWCDRHHLEPSRIFSRLLTNKPGERCSPVLIHGDAKAPLETKIREHGLSYHVRFDSGYSVGFFMDQRHNRRHLASLIRRDTTVLNCFSYTCSFSVTAAKAGADTVSVDLSRSILEKGKENFTLNKLDPTAHAFLSGDTRDYLERFRKQNRTFSVIILDPPTFSHGKKGVNKGFRVARDLPALVEKALDLLAPSGQMLLSTNCLDLPLPKLRALARTLSQTRRKKARFLTPPLPPDIPPYAMPSSLWLELES